MARSCWHDGDDSSLEAMEFLTMNPTPERCLSVYGFPDQKRVKSAPLLEGYFHQQDEPH